MILKLKQKLEHWQNFTPKITLIGASFLLLAAVIFLLGRPFLAKHYFYKTNYSQNNPEILAAAKNMYQSCLQMEKERCYEQGMNDLIQKYNFSYASQTLIALQDLDPQTKSCHVLAHDMSRAAVHKSEDRWLQLLDSVDVNACGSGFLHGVLEAHLGDKPNTKFTGALSEEVCDRGKDDYRKRMCTHFMGHFFVVQSLDHVDQAVPYCDSVDVSLKFDCLDGVFMEHNQKIALADHGLAPSPTYTSSYATDLSQTCKRFTGMPALACWTEMAEVFAKTYGYQTQKVYDHCYQESEDLSLAQSCYFKGVIILATYPLSRSQEDLVSICKVYSDDAMYKACTSDLLSSLMYYSVKFTDRGISVCQGGRDTDWCMTQLGNLLKQFESNATSRQSLCAAAEDKYKTVCASIN